MVPCCLCCGPPGYDPAPDWEEAQGEEVGLCQGGNKQNEALNDFKVVHRQTEDSILYISFYIYIFFLFKNSNRCLTKLSAQTISNVFSAAASPSAPASLRWGAVPWLRGLRVGLVALWWPKLCVPTVLPSVENGLLGRGLWDKPLPARKRNRTTGQLVNKDMKE